MLHGGLFLVRRVAAGMGIVCLFRYLVGLLVGSVSRSPEHEMASIPRKLKATFLLVLIMSAYLPNDAVRVLISLRAWPVSGPDTCGTPFCSAGRLSSAHATTSTIVEVKLPDPRVEDGGSRI